MNNLNSQLIVRDPKPDSWTFQMYWSSLKSASGSCNGSVCNRSAGLFALFFFPLSCLTLANNLQQKGLYLLFSEHGPTAQQQFQCPRQHMQCVLGLRWVLHWEWPSRGLSLERDPIPWLQWESPGSVSPCLPQQGWKAFAALSLLPARLLYSSVAQLLTRRAAPGSHQWLSSDWWRQGKPPMVLWAPGAVLAGTRDIWGTSDEAVKRIGKRSRPKGLSCSEPSFSSYEVSLKEKKKNYHLPDMQWSWIQQVQIYWLAFTVPAFAGEQSCVVLNKVLT